MLIVVVKWELQRMEERWGVGEDKEWERRVGTGDGRQAGIQLGNV